MVLYTLYVPSAVTPFVNRNLYQQYVMNMDVSYYVEYIKLLLAVLYQHSNDTSKPTCSNSLNLGPSAPLHPQTLGHNTNYY